MSVQTKILLVLGAALAAGLAALAVVLLVVVTPAFDRLDVEQAEKNVNRVQQTIANEFAVLDQKVVDWAHWDESYAFVQSGDAEYVTNNLQPASLTNLGVSFMAFYNVAGKPVWTGGFDPETEEPKDLAGLNEPAQVSAITVARTEESRHGLLQIDGKIYLVSAIDILDSNENGPAQGTLAIGKEIDDTLLADLMARTEVQFTLTPFQATDSGLATPHLVGESATQLMHRFTLSDIGGTPRLDVEIQTPRGASALGQNAVLLAGILLVATVILILVVIAFAINRLVVRPLHAINGAMQEVARSADLEKRLSWQRGDEIGELAAQFDCMLEQIAQARRELREALLKALQAVHVKSSFLSNMSHELRTPLNAIIGFSDVIHNQRFGAIGEARYVSYAADINQSAQHLLNLINDILDYSKIEAGGMALSDDIVDLDEMIAFATRLLSIRADQKSIELRHERLEQPAILSCDERRVKQVLLNLISNAIKFSPDGNQIDIAVAIAKDIQVTIRDHGIGMTPIQAEKALEPFTQIDGALTRSQEGTGLGLPISLALMKLHQGDLGIESEPNAGTTVTVTFPAHRLTRLAPQ